jgi:hypothetical protein
VFSLDLFKDNFIQNYCISSFKTLKSKNKGLTSLGMLFFLHSFIPGIEGRVKIDQIVSITGMSKHNILEQIRALEDSNIIQTTNRDNNGRVLFFAKLNNDLRECTENGTGSEFVNSSSSRSYIKKTTTTSNSTVFENGTGSEFDSSQNILNLETRNNTVIDAHSLNGIIPDFIDSEDSKDIKLPKNLEKIKDRVSKKIAANSIFFLIKAAMKSPGDLTIQAFQIYYKIYTSKGDDYANGIAFSLFSNAKENISAYFIKAVNSGAEPSQVQIDKAKQILNASKSIFLRVGEDILPKDYFVIIETLKLRNLDQEKIKEQLNSFILTISQEK